MNIRNLNSIFHKLKVKVPPADRIANQDGRSDRIAPVVNALPVVSGLAKFLEGPVVMIREEYSKHGSVFTLNLLHKNITFLIGREVSVHFFGPGVVFDVDYSVRQEQFRFCTESLRVSKLKGYVDHMVVEEKKLKLM